MAKRATLAVVGVATFLWLWCFVDGTTPSESSPPSLVSRPEAGAGPTADALTTLNEASRAAYRDAKERALAGGGPVILVSGDMIVLKYGRTRIATRVIPGVYHELKSISHIPLAAYSLVAYRPDGELDDPILYEIRQYRTLVVAARGSLEGRALREDQVRRQEEILSLSLRFLDSTLGTRRVDERALEELTRSVRPLLDANTADAARAQIDALHRQVTAWRQELTSREWGRLTVIMAGPQLPRKDNVVVQYFARLLGVPGEGPRIVYAESLFEEARAFDLLATQIVDTGIGRSFFQDPQRMYRDLLADAARTYLDKLFSNETR